MVGPETSILSAEGNHLLVPVCCLNYAKTERTASGPHKQMQLCLSFWNVKARTKEKASAPRHSASLGKRG